MKLLFCKRCQDIIRLCIEERRKCRCGHASGQYDENGETAVYSGEDAVPFAISNPSFALAVRTQPHAGWGPDFDAWVFSKVNNRIRRDDLPEEPMGV